VFLVRSQVLVERAKEPACRAGGDVLDVFESPGIKLSHPF